MIKKILLTEKQIQEANLQSGYAMLVDEGLITIIKDKLTASDVIELINKFTMINISLMDILNVESNNCNMTTSVPKLLLEEANISQDEILRAAVDSETGRISVEIDEEPIVDEVVSEGLKELLLNIGVSLKGLNELIENRAIVYEFKEESIEIK